jgi:hypothetical protein
MATIQRKHNAAIVRVSYIELKIIYKLLHIKALVLVEAAGVEPASEIEVSKETPCSAEFRKFRFARSEPARCAHR